MRLLIVEDDETLARNLQKLLQVRGFAVDHLSDGQKAKTRILLYRSDYDAILLDLSLGGGMDGKQLAEEVREEGVKTPIIILTGASDTQSKVALLNAGADDYIVKPFSSEELVARIHSVLRRPETLMPTIHSVGDLEVHVNSRRVRAGEKDVTLTLKEYSLLECFVRRPGEVLTREELYNELWDFNALTWSNVLDVHMKNLRKKLADASQAKLETVRGTGYRLVV